MVSTCQALRLESARVCLLLSLSGLSIACAGDEQRGDVPARAAEAAPHSAGPRDYTIELGGEHRVTYSVFDDGSMLVMERGDLATDESVAELLTGSPASAFRALHPGKSVPAELEAAEPLFLPRGLGPEDVELITETAEPWSGAGSAPIDKDISSDASSFTSIFGCFFGPNDVFTGCHTNSADWGTGHGNARWAIYKLAPYRGDIHVRLSGTNTGVHDFTLYQGQFVWWAMRGPLVVEAKCPNNQPSGTPGACLRGYRAYPTITFHQIGITEAEGDGFHFSIRLHNLQYATPACAEVKTAENTSWSISSFGLPFVDCRSHYAP